MKREIKFRAWVEKGFRNQKGMFTDFTFSDIESGREEANVWCKSGLLEEPKWDDIIVMQFTGLQDTNGVDIYEGDILEYWYNRDTSGKDVERYFEDVEWTEWCDGTGFNIKKHNGNYKVIGNIHENPELSNK